VLAYQPPTQEPGYAPPVQIHQHQQQRVFGEGVAPSDMGEAYR